MSLLPASSSGEVSTGFYNNVIDQSARFDGSSSELNVTPSSTGNRRTFTTSLWIKRTTLAICELHTGGSNSYNQQSTQFSINSDHQLQFYDVLAGITNYAYVRSTEVLRDTTNWYHVVLAVDTTQSTASNRVRMYINGNEVTYVTGGLSQYPNQNHDTVRNNSGTVTRIARFPNAAVNYYGGYIAEFNHIDGTQLTPTSFGETKNGVWIPKAISGLTYGTNGVRLTFADSSAIGDDTSGNGNDYTASGLASTDIVSDSPENNFPTLNVLDKKSGITLSEGNLKRVDSADAWESITAPFGMTSGKYYAEFIVTVNGSGSFKNFMVGVVKSGFNGNISDSRFWSSFDGHSYHAQDGKKVINGSGTTATYGATWTVDDIIGVALNLDDGEITFYKNNVSQGVANTGLSGEYVFACATYHSGTHMIANFGQDSSFAGNETAQNNADANGIGDFYYTPPSGYLALCSSNLPDVTIGPNQDTQADDHFNTVLYTGNGTSQSITGVGFRPDWVWTKSRDDGSLWHFLMDSSRGGGARLYSNGTGAEVTNTNRITSFDADGFSVGSAVNVNANNDPIVAWNWKANGGTTSTNDEGSKDVTVQANTTAGFSIITYSGDTSSFTLGHGLESAPEFIIAKSRTFAERWVVFHGADDQAYYYLNDTFARSTGNADERFGNSTNVVVPTDTLVTLGANNNDVSKNGENYVMYCFHSVEGYSKFGSYTGNGSTDGTFVFTGFRPAWVMIKSQAASTNGWYIYDNKRLNFGTLVDGQLYANLANAEDDGNRDLDFLSNGFKPRLTDTNVNGSGTDYIYMAFAEQPFKFSNAK